MSFHNPYHFVPVEKDNRRGDLNRKHFEKHEFGESPHMTHDRYVEKAFSGRMVCRLTADSPLVVGGQHDPSIHKKKPSIIHQYALNGFPEIPASSLRGLTSSIIETASNSTLRVLEDQTYTFRKNMKEALSAIGMIVEKENKMHLLPMVLPNIEVGTNEDVRLSGKAAVYRNIFPKPNFKVYFGDYESIRDAAFSYSSYTENNKEFYGLRLEKWQWKNNEVALATAGRIDDFLDWKTGRSIDTLIGQCAIDEQRKVIKIVDGHLRKWEQVQNDKNYVRGILRVLGCGERKADIPKNKKHELFIPFTREMEGWTTLEIPQAVIDRFERIANISTAETEKTAVNDNLLLPYHLKGTNRNKNKSKFGKQLKLKNGDLVYFAVDTKTRMISEIAFSAIWRDIVGKEENGIRTPDTTFDFFGKDKELLPFNKNRNFITIAEQMYGFVENNGNEEGDKELSLAGRIYPSSARFEGIKNDHGALTRVDSQIDCYENDPEDTALWTLLKILASPKPPSPGFYFKPDFIFKKDLNASVHAPQGRKFYLHHNSNEKKSWESRKRDEIQNLHQKMLVNPVKAGSIFFFHIDFDNLSRLELGALLYALRPTDEFRHKLGLGKPLGLGTITIDLEGIFLIDRLGRYARTNFSETRYVKAWKNENAEMPARYKAEIEARVNLNKKEVDEIRDGFRNGMSIEIRDALELVGNPAKIRANVNYPVSQSQQDDTEGENFKWFVTNDKTTSNNEIKHPLQPQNLKPLPKEKVMPTLEENSVRRR